MIIQRQTQILILKLFLMTTQNIKNTQVPLFGKYQRHFTIACLICYQMLITPQGLFLLYSLFTFKYDIVGFALLVSLIQYPFRKSQSFIQFVQKYIKPTTYYKKFIRITQEKIDPNQKILYGFHPHSIYCNNILLNMNQNDREIPDYIALGSRFGFNAPFLGLILRLWGCSTVDNQNIKRLMQQGKNIAIVPGGYEQASLTTPNQMRFYLKNRKGFVKYALKYGYTMRPVLCIGQNKAFQTFDYMKSIKLFLNKFKLPALFFINRKYLSFVDPNIEMYSIFGKGIKKQIVDSYYEPSKEDIDEYHKMYVQELSRLYRKYKSLNDDKPLVIY